MSATNTAMGWAAMAEGVLKECDLQFAGVHVVAAIASPKTLPFGTHAAVRANVYVTSVFAIGPSTIRNPKAGLHSNVVAPVGPFLCFGIGNYSAEC